MMKKYLFASLVLLIAHFGFGQLTVLVESGAALNGYNNVRYSNSGAIKGTKFSLTDDFRDQHIVPYIRVEAKYQFCIRHAVELTAAPLAFDYSGLTGTVNFGKDTYSGPGSMRVMSSIPIV